MFRPSTLAGSPALGIAHVQSVGRRVAVGDLLGDAPPLQALIKGDDPHGLVDSFQYGVSLTRIAQQVPDSGELFVMPTGTGPVDYEELFPNPRWRRLIAGFREVGALLVIAAPADAPRVHDLVDASDGVVIVGDVVPPDVSVAQSLAWVRAKRGTAPPSREAEPSPDVAVEPTVVSAAARALGRIGDADSATLELEAARDAFESLGAAPDLAEDGTERSGRRLAVEIARPL